MDGCRKGGREVQREVQREVGWEGGMPIVFRCLMILNNGTLSCLVVLRCLTSSRLALAQR
jgi:hypothetical protein